MLQDLARRFKDWLARPGAAAPAAAGAASGVQDVPEEARRLHEAGAAALREGRPEEALASFDAAVSLYPDFEQAHDQAGLALLALDRFGEAAARFQRALDARHDYVPALHHQGIAYLDLKRYEDAEDCFKLALTHDPGAAQVRVHLAMACWNLGRVDEAIEHFRGALAVDSGLVEAWALLAGLLDTQGRLEESAAAYRRLVAVQPGVAESHLNLGLALFKLGSLDEATAEFERALALKPDFPEGYFNLGNARRDLGKQLEAIGCYERALELKPDYADVYTNLGSVLREQGAVERALECYRRAAALNPGSVEPHHNMGVLFNQLGDVPNALKCYAAAQRIKPGHPASLLNLALTQLQAGDFEGGWEGYECRFRQPDPEQGTQARNFPWPVWRGEPLAGKRILVWGEQGIGDEITFSATYQDVIAAARACVIECAPKLVGLFSRSFSGARVVGRSDPPHPETAQSCDYQCPAGGLPRWVRRDLASFPARRGHLAAAPERVSYWKRRLEQLGGGLKLGFSWRSTNLKGERTLYCTRLDQWAPVFATPGVQFVCLQYDECRAELDDARSRFGAELVAFPEVDLFNDLEEAAALTQALDLVISAPTSVSLLSAALGVDTWQMTYGAHWQAHGTDRNPWYPAMTQFKRRWDQDWETIMAAVAGRLRERAAGRPVPAPAAAG